MKEAFVRRRICTSSFLCRVLVEVDSLLTDGQASEDRSQTEAARMSYGRAIDKLDALRDDPMVLVRYEKAQGLMGRLIYRELDFSTAIPYLEEHCRAHEYLYGGSTVLLLEAYVTLCMCYLRQRRADEARDTATKAVACAGKLGEYCSAYSIYAHFWLRMTEYELGNAEAAETALANTLALIDAHPELLSADETAMIRGLASK